MYKSFILSRDVRRSRIKLVTMYKTIFAKSYIPNWSEQNFVIKKCCAVDKDIVKDLNGAKTIVTFYEKELQNISQTAFRIVKVIKKKAVYYV